MRIVIRIISGFMSMRPLVLLPHFHSRHCYGDALDVRTIDVDGDSNGNGNIEQVIGNRSQSGDGVLMEELADDAGALWTASYQHYSTHTHADWTLAPKGWWRLAAAVRFSLFSAVSFIEPHD